MDNKGDKFPLNFSFGGMALDSHGTLYVNADTKMLKGTQAQFELGTILAINDSDGDGIPDKVNVFTTTSQADPLNPLTASSIVATDDPSGGVDVYLFGCSSNFTDSKGNRNPAQIVKYVDADGNFEADGDPTVFYTGPTQFLGFIGSFGPGSSGIEVDHMDFADGTALFAYSTLDSSGMNETARGIAAVKDSGSGTAGTPMSVFEAPKDSMGNLGGITFVLNVPHSANTTPPTVAVTAPTAGQMVMGGSSLAIDFTATAASGATVSSIGISLSTDGGSTFPVVVANGLAGNATSFNYMVPAALNTTMAQIQVAATDNSGNVGKAVSGTFTITPAQGADTIPPTVMITSPGPGTSLNGGAMATVNFTASDNVGVTSINISFAVDGNNFTTSLASGLAGSSTSFNFTVPAVSTMNGAIKVDAFDAAGNMGTAMVGGLTIVNDTTPPTVSVSAIAKKVIGNSMLTVNFTAKDDVGVASIVIQIATDGKTFTNVGMAMGGASSATITVPNVKAKAAVVKVIAMDAAGNMGSGVSNSFKIKPAKK
jgi:hypothetical protein